MVVGNYRGGVADLSSDLCGTGTVNLAPLMSSKSGLWQTPECVLERVRRVGPIHYDPCTTADNPVGADTYNTEETDGLTFPWRQSLGNIYCNPPYGRGMGAWVDNCIAARTTDRYVIALLPARTDTRWFPWDADALCFWKGRLTFRGAKAGAPFPSVVAYWGAERSRFIKAFEDVGAIR